MTDVLESAPRQSNPPASDKLAGGVVFVIGGIRGIGAAIAHSLANPGATVAATTVIATALNGSSPTC
jgi:hypothetical protein